MYSYDRTARGRVTLDNKTKREARAALNRGGLDGKGRFRKVGEGF